MTLWHIDDFDALAKEVPRPWPWDVIGVMPTKDDYLRLGNAAYDAHHAFAYTVSDGPVEIWVPMSSIEGRFCPPELITGIVNVIFTAVGAHQLAADDNVIVPFEYSAHNGDTPDLRDAVFWIGTPTQDLDRTRFHCYGTPHTWVQPVRWSSPEGWPDE